MSAKSRNVIFSKSKNLTPRTRPPPVVAEALEALRTSADARDDAARQLINKLGAQQTFARLGWQQNPDYEPAEPCFDFWWGAVGPSLSDQDVSDCEAHASELARLYASYGTEVDPIVFKSRYFWDERDLFDLIFPDLVEAWKDAGGNEDDPGFLDHPVCAEPLQTGWAGSDYFYDGSEHPLCRLFKLAPAAATQK